MATLSFRKQRCIVIGAGVAGIAAAVEAAIRGMEVILLDGHRYLGGRARSFCDEVTGDEIDNGQHVMMGCYRHLRQTLQVLGTEELLRPKEPIVVEFRSPWGEHEKYDPYRYPGIAGVVWGLLAMRSFPLRERIRLLNGAVRMLVSKPPLEFSVATWLQQVGQSPLTIARFWEPLVLATLNAPLEDADAALLQAVLRRAFFGGGDSHYLLVPRVGLSHLWEPLPEWLANHGGEVYLGTQAEELLWLDDRIIGVATRTGEEIRGTIVIAALPPKALLRLLPSSLCSTFAPIEQFETMPIVSVYLWFDRQLDIPPVTGLWGTAAQWVFNRDRLVDRPAESRRAYPGHLEVTISGARELSGRSPEEIMALVMEDLHKTFPFLKNSHLQRGRVIKERAATVLLTPKTVRQRLRTWSGTRGLYFAGDWTATGLPATLESAAASGIAAVRAATTF